MLSDIRGLGPFEATPCFDCKTPDAGPESIYVKRGLRLVRVCIECALEAGDDALAAHRTHCNCEPRCEP